MSLTRLLPAGFHAVADYAVAALLILVPLLAGGSKLAVATGVVIGVVIALVSALTRYPLGVVKVLPFTMHSAGDYLAFVLLVASPFALGYTGTDHGLAVFYVCAGDAVLAVSLITNYQYSPKRRAATVREPVRPAYPAAPVQQAAPAYPAVPREQTVPDQQAAGGYQPVPAHGVPAHDPTLAAQQAVWAQRPGEYEVSAAQAVWAQRPGEYEVSAQQAVWAQRPGEYEISAAQVRAAWAREAERVAWAQQAAARQASGEQQQPAP